MGVVRHEWNTPKKARYKALIENGMSGNAAAKTLGIPQSTAWRWKHQTERRTRPLSTKLGRQPIVTDDHVNKMILWITGHYNRRILPLQTIAREACSLTASHSALSRAWARWGYHYHTPDSKPFLLKEQKLKRFIFALKNWDRPLSYWRKGIYTDESTTRTNTRRRVKVLRKRGERRRLDCVQFTFHSGRSSIMC